MSPTPRAPRTAFSPMVSALTFALVVVPACNDAGPTPRIVAVAPDFSYSDGDVTLIVDAPGTRPSLLVDLDSQSATFEPSSVRISLVPSDPDGRPEVPLSIKKWLKMGRFLAGMSPGVAAGAYDVKMVGPNGLAGTLARAFLCGGARGMGPSVSVSLPMTDQVVSAGDDFKAAFAVDDFGGQLVEVSWETSEGATMSCPLPRDKDTGTLPSTFDTALNPDCTRVPTPPSGSFASSPVDFVFSVTATDVSGLTTVFPVPLLLAQPPLITKIKNVVGAPAGGQPFTVTGKFFPFGTEASIGGVRILDPITGFGTGGIWRNDTTIEGLTPPNQRPETLEVTVKTPWRTSAVSGVPFRYTLPPLIRLVRPATGPAAGGIAMTIVGNDLLEGVVIKFGPTLGDAKELVNSHHEADAKVVGLLPPGHGTVSVWAVDSITGTGQAVDAFTYVEDVPPPPGLPVTLPVSSRPRSP